MRTFILALLVLVAPVTQANANFFPENTPEYCMAMNIYHESRGSNRADKVAVADVVLNRVNSDRFPNTVCDVVTQAKMSEWWKREHGKDVPVKHRCQFSWFCDGKSDKPTDEDAWVEAQYIAYEMIELERYVGITEGATHYHATYVTPRWAKDFSLVGRIGAHIFYRWEN